MIPKIKRRWVKEEKRIVRLLYRKGFLKDFKITELYWAEYNWLNNKKYKTKHKYDGRFYRFPVYMPEIYYYTTDYWGESDEHSIVSTIKEKLYWSEVDTENWNSELGYPKSNFPKLSRRQFIKYLDKLPTIISDNKINKIVKRYSYND